MQYKTTIEVVTEAGNEHEATDIAGEYLKGDFSSGADLRVKTVSSVSIKRMNTVLAFCAILAVSGTFVVFNNVSFRMAKTANKPVTSYAIQPPLKTTLSDLQSSKEFKEIWEKTHKDRINSLAR